MLNQLLEYLSQTIPLISNGYFRQQRAGEYCSPSPFRRDETGRWGGDDGLLWFFNTSKGGLRVWDRKTGESLPMAEVVQNFMPNPPSFNWKKIEEDVKQQIVTTTQPFNSVDQTLIDYWHRQVKTDYWTTRGFSNTIINHFKLGYGAAIPNSPMRHIIPLRISPTQWTFMTRLDDHLVEKDNPYLAKHRNQVGAGHIYFIDDYLASTKDTLYITEGGLSFLSAVEMGFYPALVTNGGSSVWNDSWTLDILTRRPELKRIVFLQDNDTAGQTYVKRILTSIQNVLRQNELLREFEYLWLDTSIYQEEGDDCADILSRFGVERGRQLIQENLETITLEDVNPRFVHNRYIQKLQLFEQPKETIDLATLRDPQSNHALTRVINNFLENYRKLYRDKTLILAAEPGTGKNFALIHVLQERAKLHSEVISNREKDNIDHARQLNDYLSKHRNMMSEEDIKAHETVIKRLIKPKKRIYAIVASPFRESFFDMREAHVNFDPSLWFYFESRSKENCENFEKADKAQQLGFNVSQEVCTFCPFKQMCEQKGYLSQFDKMTQYPLVSVRHQHLVQESLANLGKVLVIDESPLSTMIASSRIEVSSKDIVLPIGWQEFKTQIEIRAISQFVTVLRNLISEGAYQRVPAGRIRIMYSGKSLFDKLEEISQQNFSLSIVDVLNALTLKTISDLVMTFSETLVAKNDEQLNNYKVEDTLPKRCLDIIYSILSDELINFLMQKEAWNSKIVLEGNTLYVTPVAQLAVASTKPVLVLDATPIKPLYDKLLAGREALVYAPSVRNPDTKTTVLYGNGFGITKLTENIKNTDAANPDSPLPNNYMQISFDAIKKLTNTHKDLLIVTHKAVATFLEKRCKAVGITNVAFVNFRGVRGLNTYADMEAVLVIGTPIREPMSFIRDTTAWFSDDDEPLNFDVHAYVDIPYHNHVSVVEDNQVWQDGFKIRTFADKRVSDVYLAEIATEIQQVATRIRPHTSEKPKSVYLLSSFPALPYVTDTIYYNNFIYDLPTSDGMEEFGRMWLEQHVKNYCRFPGQLRFCEALRKEGKFKLGEHTGRELLAKLKAEFVQKNGKIK